jgi:hypothetical protein
VQDVGVSDAAGWARLAGARPERTSSAGLLLARDVQGDVGGPAPDSGPPVCQDHSGGDNRCPGG